MKRIYLSGSQKRKAAEDKKARETAALRKIPKINELFSTVPSSSTSTSTLSESVIETTRDSEKDISTSHADFESIAETAEDEGEHFESNVSASTSLVGESSSAFRQFPTDVALWNIQTELTSLQKYFAEKGAYT